MWLRWAREEAARYIAARPSRWLGCSSGGGLAGSANIVVGLFSYGGNGKTTFANTLGADCVKSDGYFTPDVYVKQVAFAEGGVCDVDILVADLRGPRSGGRAEYSAMERMRGYKYCVVVRVQDLTSRMYRYW